MASSVGKKGSRFKATLIPCNKALKNVTEYQTVSMYFNCLPKQKLKDIHKEYKKYLEYTVEFLVSTHNYQPKESRKYNQ